MNFTKYETVIFNDLNKFDEIESVILESVSSSLLVNSLYVNSITVCNKSSNNIRINLQKAITGSDDSIMTGFLIQNLDLPTNSNLDINKKSTVNLISLFGLDVFLPTSTKDGVTYTTSLLCYSNAVTQIFDCTVDYTVFVEPRNYN